MALKDQITEDMKTAMRAKDSARLGTIRLLLAACKQKEVDERVTLDDTAVIGIIDDNGLQKPHAWVIPKREGPDLARELADYVARELLPYKAPRTVHLVAELPRTHLGKIDRGALKRLDRKGETG